MKYIYIILFAGLIGLTSCDDLLENELASNKVEFAFNTADEIQELLNSSYDVVANANNGTNQKFAELLADNVFIPGNSGFLVQVYNRSTDFFNSDVGGYYAQPYIAINRANIILENADKVDITADELNRIRGEALFIRALCHSIWLDYLLNLTVTRQIIPTSVLF